VKDDILALQNRLAKHSEDYRSQEYATSIAELLAEKEEEKEFYRLQVIECRREIDELKRNLQLKNSGSITSSSLSSFYKSEVESNDRIITSNTNGTTSQCSKSSNGLSEQQEIDSDSIIVAKSESGTVKTEQQVISPIPTKHDPPEEFGTKMLDMYMELSSNLTIDNESYGKQSRRVSPKYGPPKCLKSNSNSSNLQMKSIQPQDSYKIEHGSNMRLESDSLDLAMESSSSNQHEKHLRDERDVDEKTLVANENDCENETILKEVLKQVEKLDPVQCRRSPIKRSKNASPSQNVSNQNQLQILYLQSRSSESVSQLSVPSICKENRSFSNSVEEDEAEIEMSYPVVDTVVDEEQSDEDSLLHNGGLEENMNEEDKDDDTKYIEYEPMNPSTNSKYSKFALDEAMSIESEDDSKEDHDVKDNGDAYAIAKKYSQISKAYSAFSSLYGIARSVSQESEMSLEEEADKESGNDLYVDILGQSSDSNYSHLLSLAHSNKGSLDGSTQSPSPPLSSYVLPPNDRSMSHAVRQESPKFLVGKASQIMEEFALLKSIPSDEDFHPQLDEEEFSDDEKENENQGVTIDANTKKSSLPVSMLQRPKSRTIEHASGGLNEYLMLSKKIKNTRSTINSRGYHYR